jgi:hypothetical protein
MDGQPLPHALRLRIIVGGVCAAVVFLLFVPIEIAAVTSHRHDIGGLATAFGIGVGVPVAFAALMWWRARQYRRNPEVRRRQLNGPAARTVLFGNLIVIVLANIARGASGVPGWGGFLNGLAVLVVGSFVVLRIAKRQDPRAHYFRRPDPLPEGQTPEDDRPPAPW